MRISIWKIDKKERYQNVQLRANYCTIRQLVWAWISIMLYMLRYATIKVGSSFHRNEVIIWLQKNNNNWSFGKFSKVCCIGLVSEGMLLLVLVYQETTCYFVENNLCWLLSFKCCQLDSSIILKIIKREGFSLILCQWYYHIAKMWHPQSHIGGWGEIDVKYKETPTSYW